MQSIAEIPADKSRLERRSRQLKTAVICLIILALASWGIYVKQRNRGRAVHVAATELRSALSVGVTYSEFGAKLQKLASETELASENGLGQDKIALCRDALETYKDSYDLWSDKIQNPKLYDTVEQSGELSFKLRELINKYQVRVIPLFQKQKVYHFLDKATVELLHKEDKENPERARIRDGYFDLDRTYDVVLQEIWRRAGAKLDATETK